MFPSIKNVDKKGVFVTEIRDEVAFLENELKKFAVVKKVYPSDTNFLLVRFADAGKIFQYLMNQRVIVRDRSKLELCQDTFRITAGTRMENETLLKALNNYSQTL